MPYVDTVITSPPYEASLEGTSRHTKGGIASRDKKLAQTGSLTVLSEDTKKGVPIGYSPNKNNIGNLKSPDEEYEALVDSIITSPPFGDTAPAMSDDKISREKKLYGYPNKEKSAHGGDRTSQIARKRQEERESYLQAMFKVYREMFRVLKPGGRAIVIVKAFQRNFKIVDLPYHTFLLMSGTGFVLEKLYKLRLKQQSFWRILLYRKHPGLPRISHEYVLVMKKP
jgi:DNA modification methylase